MRAAILEDLNSDQKPGSTVILDWEDSTVILNQEDRACSVKVVLVSHARSCKSSSPSRGQSGNFEVCGSEVVWQNGLAAQMIRSPRHKLENESESVDPPDYVFSTKESPVCATQTSGFRVLSSLCSIPMGRG